MKIDFELDPDFELAGEPEPDLPPVGAGSTPEAPAPPGLRVDAGPQHEGVDEPMAPRPPGSAAAEAARFLDTLGGPLDDATATGDDDTDPATAPDTGGTSDPPGHEDRGAR